MKFGKLSVIMALVLLFGMLAPPAAVAQTDYDDLVAETLLPRLNLPLPSVCSAVDFGLKWTEGFDSVYPGSSFPDSVRQGIKDAFFDSTDSPTGAFAVSMSPSFSGYQVGSYAFSRVRVFFAIDANETVSQFHYEHHGSGVHANQLRLDATPDSLGNYPWGYAEFQVDESDCRLKLRTGAVEMPAGWGERVIASKLISYGDRYSVQNNEFLFSTFAVEYPEGYEGEEVPDAYTPSAPTYVAMGDSFSSGEGNPPFEYGTDEDDNKCHRSSQAYPHLLADDPILDVKPMVSVACSGATIDSVLNGHAGTGNWNEGAQINMLSEETEVVTITIGGNDVGFKMFATNCALASCRPHSPAYNNILGNINGSFQDNLESAYKRILDESGDARVYVVAYPLLVGDSINGDDCQTFETLSDYGARAVTNALNYRIESAVENVRSNAEHPNYSDRLTFVPVNSAIGTSSFDGNFICSSPSYFNDLQATNEEYSFHPNSIGHLAYSQMVKGAMS